LAVEIKAIDDEIAKSVEDSSSARQRNTVPKLKTVLPATYMNLIAVKLSYQPERLPCDRPEDEERKPARLYRESMPLE
jgi:hypothetical protein